MENDILKHRKAVQENILKSFGAEVSEDSLEKAFEDEVNLFEMEAYKSELTKAELDEFEKAKHQDGDMHPNGKWVWRQSASGGKGDWRVAKPSRGSGSKDTNVAAAANADTTSKPKDNAKSTSDFDSLSSAKTQLEVNKFWENLLTSNSGKGKNLAGKLLDSMKEYGYNNVSGAMTTRGINTFKFANKDADMNITMVPYQDGLVIKTNDKKEILKVSDFKTISDFKKKFDETVLKLSGKKDDKKKPEKSSYESKEADADKDDKKKIDSDFIKGTKKQFEDIYNKIKGKTVNLGVHGSGVVVGMEVRSDGYTEACIRPKGKSSILTAGIVSVLNDKIEDLFSGGSTGLNIDKKAIQ